MDVKDIKVIHEDENILILDKPSGLVVNRSETSSENTLQDYIEKEYDLISKYEDRTDTTDINDASETEIDTREYEEFIQRSGIVHRLDKDTSGVLIVTKNPSTFSEIKNQFKKRLVEKEYLALVLGELEEVNIEINAPIGRNPNNRLKFAVTSDGKNAVTTIVKLKEITLDNLKFTLVKAIPETGRTHQIRVHLASINHPIAGDLIYLTKSQYDACSKYFSRLMLHSHKISFINPYNNKKVTYETEIPKEFLL